MPVGDLIRANATDPARATRVFLRFDDARVTYAEYYAECARWANLFLHIKAHASLGPAVQASQAAAPFHVGVLLDNIPDYFYALGGAALAGAVIVGINNTKRGGHLARDIAHTDCQILVTEEKYLELLDPVFDETGVAPERVLVTRRWNDPSRSNPRTREPANSCLRDLEAALAEFGGGPDPRVPVSDTDPFVFLFTSGTVTAP